MQIEWPVALFEYLHQARSIIFRINKHWMHIKSVGPVVQKTQSCSNKLQVMQGKTLHHESKF